MPTIVHFDIASDDTERASKFYHDLFGWAMFQPPGITNYFLIETKDQDGNTGVGGGLGKRGLPSQCITPYIGVKSVDEYCDKVKKLGGTVVQEKMAVPGWGYLAACLDTEGNMFGLWQAEKASA